VLDASAIQFVDSKGLEALVDAYDAIAQTGQSLKLCGVNETIRQVLELTELASRFEHFADVNAAVRSFL
jgi:anti-anti-sigma factor